MKESLGKMRGVVGSLFLIGLFVVAAAPVWAGSLDKRINALEDEIAQLKADQQDAKKEQMELKQDALAAKAKLPTFSYRPGSGIRMEGPKKAWSLRMRFRYHNWLLFRDGKARDRGGQGEVFARRVRPQFYWCLDNCFYEFVFRMDFDGNDEMSGNTNSQRQAAFIHFERMNPWLPTFYFGTDAPNTFARRRSSSTDAQLDYDILSRTQFNTGSMSTGMGLRWRNLPLKGLGIPGRIGLFNITRGNLTPGDGKGRFTDKANYTVALYVDPFRNLKKNKWLKGIEWSIAAWFCNFDHASADAQGVKDSDINACARIRLRETDGPEKISLWEADRKGIDDSGPSHFIMQTLRWRVGPYTLRTSGGWMRLNKAPGGVHAKQFEISHQLFVWSPKGFLTGSSSKKGSILVGYTFNRADGYCNPVACDNDSSGTDEFTNNHMYLNQLAVWWFMRSRISAGVIWNHWNAHAIESDKQEQLEIRKTGRPGAGGSWDNVILSFRWEF